MASDAARGVFISYSRENGEVVTIAAKLLRAGGATVFQDVVDVEYGSDWQEALAKAIRQCERVLIFWSLAASTSEWVEREWRMALRVGKRIVPMLLDKTPLPKELARLNGMPELMHLLMLVKQPPTLLGTGDAVEQPSPHPPPSAPRASSDWRPGPPPPLRPVPARARSHLLPSLGVACGVAICAVLFYSVRPFERPVDVVATAASPASAAAAAIAAADPKIKASSPVPTDPGPASATASAAATASTPSNIDVFTLPSAVWGAAIVVALLLLLGIVAPLLFGRHKGKPKVDGGSTRAEADIDPFSVDTPARRNWEESVTVLDLGRPSAADTDSRLVREIGPVFTKKLFD